MIKSYKYIETVHAKLHEYVMAFFQKIETDLNGFRDELFEPEFLPIVNRHRKILKERFKAIYEYVNTITPTERKEFCQIVIESNQIERICRGEFIPKSFVMVSNGIDKTLEDLFLDLYNQVLDGDPFREVACTTLREHFNEFSDANKDITLCPVCGINELKKSQDVFRDQYDHYLPKSIYPFSSINFYNLVPCCRECNSLDVKGDKDIIALSTGKLFFPYDSNHHGITLTVKVTNDDMDVEKIEWELVFSCPDNKCDEIESWKRIYLIESRYQSYIKSHITKWYKCYSEFISSSKMAVLDFNGRKQAYMISLSIKESEGIEYIHKPALEGLLLGSNIIQAKIQSMEYV